MKIMTRTKTFITRKGDFISFDFDATETSIEKLTVSIVVDKKLHDITEIFEQNEELWAFADEIIDKTVKEIQHENS